MSFIHFKTSKIYYNDKGEGKTIVLLHGFTESMAIWDKFVRSLSKEFRVITIDLPGHGKSGNIAKVHTMELLADVVYQVLKACRVTKCLMVGHSMGGYTTLAFAGKYPEMLSGMCIFHSHCFADSEEDRKNRERTIKVVEQDKFGFVTAFINGLFPAEVQKKFAVEIGILIRRANTMNKEGVTAAIEGMKARKDQTQLLKTTKLPVLFILGLKDSKAPLPRLWEMISLPVHSEALILRDTGHMGYIENPKETLAAIRCFAVKIS
jgi:pimeloyl-ACP methyl ester carboxylesterase